MVDNIRYFSFHYIIDRENRMTGQNAVNYGKIIIRIIFENLNIIYIPRFERSK